MPRSKTLITEQIEKIKTEIRQNENHMEEFGIDIVQHRSTKLELKEDDIFEAYEFDCTGKSVK